MSLRGRNTALYLFINAFKYKLMIILCKWSCSSMISDKSQINNERLKTH